MSCRLKSQKKAYRAKSYVKPDGLWETVGSVYLFSLCDHPGADTVTF